MRESYWGYWLIVLGIFIIGVMLLVNNISSSNTQDYYNIKEVTQASMVDAIDFSYLRLFGNLKISEQKFVENFYRRFAENVNGANTYDIDMYALYEVPPKVSVKISSGSKAFNIGNTLNSYDNVSTITTILELGAVGEKTTDEFSYVKHSCQMNFSTKLMQFFVNKGKDGMTINDVRKFGLEVTDEQLEKVSKMTSFEDFKKWFNDELKIEGQPAGDYLKEVGYNDLNGVFKEFIRRGWITIDA